MRTNRLGRDELGSRLRARYPGGLVRQGISAELIAARWRLTREELDRYALRSHQRAAAASDSGLLGRQITPVTKPDGSVVDRDEGIRRDTTLEALGRLPAAFVDDAAAERFPEIGWVVTAGSSSQVSDGASAALIMTEGLAQRLDLTPRAAFVAGTAVGADPITMLTGVIPATQQVLAKTGHTIEDLDAYEVNEAFAPVVLAWLNDTRADPERLNTTGGAIAYGHPVGASGGRLLASLLDALDANHGRYGLLAMCESGGMANATLMERMN